MHQRRLSLLPPLLLAPLSHTARILAIVSDRGSLGGGTYVTIFGDGFQRDGQDGTTRVCVRGALRACRCPAPASARAGVRLTPV